MTLKRIVSGPQTGVNRAALDAALTVGFPCGGGAAADRMAGHGVTSDRYRLIVGNYRRRTRLYVVESDGTAILFSEALKGGMRLTRNLCALLERHSCLIATGMWQRKRRRRA
jgi:hypothetical protein